MPHFFENSIENNESKGKKKSPNFVFRLFKLKKNFIGKSCEKIENTFLSKMDRTDNSSGMKYYYSVQYFN